MFDDRLPASRFHDDVVQGDADANRRYAIPDVERFEGLHDSSVLDGPSSRAVSHNATRGGYTVHRALRHGTRNASKIRSALHKGLLPVVIPGIAEFTRLDQPESN